MATLLSRSPRRLLRFLKPQTLLSPTLASSSPSHDLPARTIPPLGLRESGWSAPPQWQWHRHRALWTYSNPQNSGACDAGLAAAPGASSLPLRMRRGRAASTDVAEVSADKGVGANGAHQAAAKEDGDPETSLCSKAIKIMTYNVCFGKDYELHSRILALGNIIQHHSPDLICLQEVTPEIHGLMEKSAWWPEYKCFMSREMEYYMKEKEDIARSNMGKPLSKRKKYMERSYFCMQMSKLPVDSFDGVPFSNSVMGRELCMANINIGGVSLVLGTSHLESPSPPPRLRSNERAGQAKESLMLLGGRGSRNAIFCGDMNWDDKTDGPFPLPDGWVDPWAELKPGEDGWTYDTEANAMLSAAVQKRQLRLDRFVCKLLDFRVQCIEMVGREPIPGVSHVKVDVICSKSKKKVHQVRREITLPVLPSDHFGLVLTIAPHDGSSASSEWMKMHCAPTQCHGLPPILLPAVSPTDCHRLLPELETFTVTPTHLTGKTEYLSTGDSKTSLCSKAIKIMTYNLCSRKDYKLHNRILALGDIIRLHSPDLICLQEVTPEVHGLLERSDWWPEYKCLMSRGMEYYTEAGKPLSKGQKWRSYFCMQMSKLVVDSFDGVPFSNSVMGRELCMANINIGGVTLVLGTSHLESPSRPPRLRSNERVAQAKESLMLLGGRGSCNLIFCGDMNWDDKADGPFPLPDGWVDAWAELKPGEDGWTYDTEANAMLSKGSKKLQLRLDRFVCKLPDFEVQGIEMVGKEPIPGVSYVKVDVARWKIKEKVYRQRRERMLPVLPSDHFGLVLTITPRAGSSASSE